MESWILVMTKRSLYVSRIVATLRVVQQYSTDRMHSIYQRFNNLSALLSSCVLTLLGAIAISSFFLGADPKGTVAVGNIKVYVTKDRSVLELEVIPR